MAKTTKEFSFEELLRDIRSGHFFPVYYLMGEEDYYIDRLSDAIQEVAVVPEARDFDLMITYAGDLKDLSPVVNAARRFPMMSERQVVMVKEAQGVKDLTLLQQYLQQPLESTVLVFCHKHGTLDRRKKVATLIQEKGVLFESKRIRENLIPQFVTDYMRQKGDDIEDKAAAMMADMVGADLSRLSGELDKLHLALRAGQRTVTAKLVEDCVGISKDYNNFELRNALIERDVDKANRIVSYMAHNQKANPIQMTLAMLFSFFSNLMVAYYAPDKNEQGVAAQLDFRTPFMARDYVRAMRVFPARKTMDIVAKIRECDARSKGVENNSVDAGYLLKELVYFILH